MNPTVISIPAVVLALKSEIIIGFVSKATCVGLAFKLTVKAPEPLTTTC